MKIWTQICHQLKKQMDHPRDFVRTRQGQFQLDPYQIEIFQEGFYFQQDKLEKVFLFFKELLQKEEAAEVTLQCQKCDIDDFVFPGSFFFCRNLD
jgi:hypothetical protein